MHRRWETTLALLFLGACSGGSAVSSDGTRNLLATTPTETIATDALLRPTKRKGWGRQSGGGWSAKALGPDPKGRYFISATEESAHLLLEVTGAADRVLRVLARSQGDSSTVELTLNGEPIATLDLGPNAAPVLVDVPEALWRVGSNQLTFKRDPKASHGIFVYELGIDPAEGVRSSGSQLQLDSTTGVLWRLELAGPADLKFAFEGDAHGTAHVALETLDPMSGQIELLGQQKLTLQGGRQVKGRIPIPRPRGKIMQLRIGWSATSGKGALSVLSLDLDESKPLTRPPILFVSIDTLAAQNLSVYGYERQTTPNLAAFAEDSVLFDRARSNAPWTIPSYASQFTGIYSRANMTKRDLGGGVAPAWETYDVGEYRWTLGEMLRAAGYVTGAFVDNLWLSKVSGFDQGFEVYDTQAAVVGRDNPDGGMRMVFPQAVEFLDTHRGNPVFCFAQVVDVHGPYTPGPQFKGHFEEDVDPENLTMLPVVRMKPTLFGGIPRTIVKGRYGGEGELPDSVAADYFQANYDEKILELDSVLGELFDSLKSKGLYDDLLIIVSADHGESMVDHDFFFRHGLNYESAIHVPLIIKMPGQAHAGKRIESPVQLVDLYPTLADVIGLPVDDRTYLHGRSILEAMETGALPDVPLLGQAEILGHSSLVLGNWKLVESSPRGAPLDGLLSSVLIQESLYRESPDLFVQFFEEPPPIGPLQVVDRVASLLAEDPVLCRHISRRVRGLEPILELFDIANDPRETNNLAQEHPELVQRMLTMMEEERRRAEALRFEGQGPDIQLDAHEVDELRALGYMGED